MVKRVEHIWVKGNNLNGLCHISKNLYNEANYIIISPRKETPI